MSLDRLKQATQSGLLSPEQIRASLGKVGLSPATRLLEADRVPSTGLEVIAVPERRLAFELAFKFSKKIAGYIDLPAPTPEAMAEAGVDFAYLAKYPGNIVLAPHGLGLGNWQAIYIKATADQTIPNNPLKAKKNGHGLYVWDSAKNNWPTFDKAPTVTTTPGRATLPNLIVTAPDGTTVTWTIRIIPGKQTPDHLGADYHGNTIDPTTKKLISPATPPTHQTVPEMLTDKLTTIFAGKAPSDTDTSSWCDNGDLAAGSAPFGDWRSGGGRVVVGWLSLGLSSAFLGSRPSLG